MSRRRQDNEFALVSFTRIILTSILLLGPMVAKAQSLDPVNQFFDVIRKDHAAILSQIEKVESSKMPWKRAFRQLESLLIPHLKGEEVAFYPALARATDGILAKHAAKDHQDIMEALRTLMRMDPTEPNFPSHFDQFKEALKEHMKLEEEKVFDQAKKKLEDDQMQRILIDYQVTKQLSERVYEGHNRRE